MPKEKEPRRFWVGPRRHSRRYRQTFQPVDFPTRKRARHVQRVGGGKGARVKKTGGGISGWWVVLIIIAALIIVSMLAGCKPVDAGRGKPVPSPTAAPFVQAKPLHGQVYVAHRVGAESIQRVTVPRNPAGLFERSFVFSTTNPRSAEVLATRNFEGQLGCYIWYVRDNKVWLVDYDESLHGGGVACKINEISLKAARKSEGRKLEDCDCTVGNDTVVMRVTWIPDGDHQETDK